MRLRTPLRLLLVACFMAPQLAHAAIVGISVGPGPANVFLPQFQTINAGDTVRWTLIGGTHNVSSDTGLFRSGEVGSSWDPFDHTFNTAGMFGYHCELHGSPGLGMFGTITVNDTTGGPGTIRFTRATASVSESAANVTLTAERINGSTGAVSVAYATANGSATSGSDYQTTTGALSWGDGDSANKTFQVPIVSDTIEEPSETFTATLSAPTGGAAIGTPSTAVVTITDDDAICDPCVADATTLCLAGGSGNPARFQVRVNWTDFAGGTGAGQAVPNTPDAGFFYFFNDQNLELLIKMVNGCTFNNHYWFFNAAASNVGLTYQVRDTVTCQDKTMTNPLGTFASNGDIDFFATCP